MRTVEPRSVAESVFPAATRDLAEISLAAATTATVLSPKPVGRVTQTDIARAAGVHNTTVSLALRNSHAIPETTRTRIQAIAQRMGYSPDPALQALVAYRNLRRPKRPDATLAYVTNGETKTEWRTVSGREQSFLSAQKRAASLGYLVEHFWLGESGMSARRLNSMLLHRGITGLVLAFHRPPEDDMTGLDWSRLCAVQIGNHALGVTLNQVVVDQARIVGLALQQLLARGYKRPGFVIAHGCDRFAATGWAKAIHAEQYSLAPSARLPVLDLPEAPDCPGDRLAAVTSLNLTKWSQTFKPDVIVSTSSSVLRQLHACGLAVPCDVAYVDLTLEERAFGAAGINQHPARVGELAVELLAAQLQVSQFGLPPLPTVTSIAGVWTDGTTLASNASVRRAAG